MLDTQKGTTKFKPTRSHVAGVASPPAITEPWLIKERSVPTTIAILIVIRSVERANHRRAA
jgi:hypothetical protein